jgi:ubiquilin
MSDETTSELLINIKGPSELKLQIAISNDKTVLELKQAIAEKSDVEADRQRLIYSGRVLKDEDALSVYKIQSSHTIHMVKGISRSSGSSSQQASSPQALPNMQTGQNPHDPLTQLNSHMGYGAMAGLNPFADMGLNPNDPNMLQTMMNSPQFLEQMSGVMSNPAIIDQIIAQNPQLAAMGPQIREVFRSERFRELVSNPDSLRTMLQMSSMMTQSGMAPFGGMGAGGFPAPGNPTGGFPAPGTPGNAANNSDPASGLPPAQAIPSLASLFGAGPAASTGTAPNGAGAIPPFDPAMMQQLLGGGAGGGGAGAPFGFGGFGGGGAAPATPSDTRPPEERFQAQLQQLNEMGFTNASQNVRALLATAGNVHSAIEYILGGGGL